jgi:hypothetical protein
LSRRFLFQFLQHRFRQPLLERTTVENLQSVNLSLMFGEIITKCLNQSGGFLPGSDVEVFAQNFVRRIVVDCLLGFFFSSSSVCRRTVLDWNSQIAQGFANDLVQMTERNKTRRDE